MKSISDYINALDAVTWYNGLAETVFGWRDIPKKDGCGDYLLPPDNYGAPTGWDTEQLQVIWMIAILLYGNYGTSPRCGWIEDVEGFREWILSITETWRSSDDYSGPEEHRVTYSMEADQ